MLLKKNKKVRQARWFTMHSFSEKAAVLKGLVHMHSQRSLSSFGLA